MLQPKWTTPSILQTVWLLVELTVIKSDWLTASLPLTQTHLMGDALWCFAGSQSAPSPVVMCTVVTFWNELRFFSFKKQQPQRKIMKIFLMSLHLQSQLEHVFLKTPTVVVWHKKRNTYHCFKSFPIVGAITKVFLDSVCLNLTTYDPQMTNSAFSTQDFIPNSLDWALKPHLDVYICKYN